MKSLFLLVAIFVVLTASCAKPQNGSNGAAGASGAPGQSIVGPAGPTGASGSPGTQVIMVQFCSNAGPTAYPSTFPEYAECINGNLYAVYWDGRNAWLAEVVPGYYASTSTSAPCNFTVYANCQVVEQ